MNKIRREDLEKEFKKRYNRVVEIYENILGNPHITQLEIKSSRSYTITEYRENGLTQSVDLVVGDKLYKYNRYLDAEVSIADFIGEEK